MTQKRILIVDDELMLLYSLRRMLDDVYDVTIAHGGKAAIDLLNKPDNKYDLIISDVSMPDINGVNLYLYIAKHHPELEKKVIFMTGGTMSAYLDEFLVTNKAICLTKPFEAESLRQTIKDCIDSNPS
jgi:two-component system NtrC family sensor kinase